MSRLQLSANAGVRLRAQLNLSGTFTHTLHNANRVSMQARVTIEPCSAAIHVRVEMGRSCNSLTLDRRNGSNPARLARFIESIANGECPLGIPEPGEHELASDMEIALRSAIGRGRGTHDLPVEDLEVCLRMRTGWGGEARAELEVEGTRLGMVLPANREQAYRELERKVGQLIASHRAAQAA